MGNRLESSSRPVPPEWLVTLAVVAALGVASTWLMLVRASPELSWDEAAYAANTADSWGFLWAHADYDRHNHGPMAIYLAKLGEKVFPAELGSLENRLRFFPALVGSLAVGGVYGALRHIFQTSRGAALASASLLLCSVIRLDETNIIGPHDLMLVCTLALLALGYHWRDRPTGGAALGLGAVIAFGALSMTYIIPAALCWALAVGLAGQDWFRWDRKYFKISWSVFLIPVVAAVLVAVFWPPGLFRKAILKDFLFYLYYSHHPTLVGSRIYEVTPHWAAFYWLARLDLPLLVCSLGIIGVAVGKTLLGGKFSSRHAYLAVWLGFFLVTALAAHLAGARNLLQFLGVLVMAAGVLYDEAFGDRPRLARFGVSAIILLSGINLLASARLTAPIPSLATDGYRAFLRENGPRLQEKVEAEIYGLPILQFYGEKNSAPIAWNATEMPWTTQADPPLPADAKYVLMPAFVYEDMPADQPMRRIVADHWKVVWSYRTNHAWELRLYENPQTPEATP
jgi:hypothetical protein